MIKILNDGTCLAVGFFREETSEFQYGEYCDGDRLIAIITAFPDREVHILVSGEWLLEELYFVLPHLRNVARSKIQRNLDSRKELGYYLPLIKSSPKKRKASKVLYSCYIGIIIGSFLLSPISSEYKETVVAGSNLQEKILQSAVDNSLPPVDLLKLYTFAKGLARDVNVESIRLSDGKVSVILSTSEPNLKLENTVVLKNSVLTKTANVKKSDGELVYFYQWEGRYDSL